MYLYLITNTVNDKKYIGITNNPKKRWSAHKNNQNPNMAIAKAIQKYGADNFNFQILLSGISIEQIDDLEIKYIKEYHTHISEGKGYNISKGGRYNIANNIKEGVDNGRALLTEQEVKYIKSHRNIPQYVLYDDFSEKIKYATFRNIYNNKTYKNIFPTVECYPYNNEFSCQFATTNKIGYGEVIELRKQYANLVPWEKAYEGYENIYPNKMNFWNVYNGNRFKLVMPEVFTKENKHCHSRMGKIGDKNGRAKLTWEQVNQIRHDYENNIKTRKELQEQYDFVSKTSINQLLRYKTWVK